MAQSTTASSVSFTPYAPLAAIGLYLRQIDFLAPIREHVKIEQRKLVHSPLDKLTDAFISILAGAHGLVEVNTRLRSDRALQEAFGRTNCAEQSTIQDTLNACTEATVQQMEQALTLIYRQHSKGYRHNYQRRLQILDVDMSGLPCGPKAALATKGYFANQRNRRGRQLGRVVATRYGEIVSEQVFTGTVGLAAALQPLVQAAEQVLGLDPLKRQRTLLRIDSGGGSIDDVNWALLCGYQLHTKDYSRQRARKLGQSVLEWFDDPEIPGRQVGWVTTPASEYARPVGRIAVRWKLKNGQWEYAAVANERGAVVLFTARELRALNQYRNKRFASLQAAMARKQKRSRRWKRLARRKSFLRARNNRQRRDIEHKLTRAIANHARAEGAKRLVVGDVREIGTGKRLNANAQQKVSGWSHGRQIAYLSYKLAAFGITLSRQSEAYSSKTCTCCGTHNKPKGRRYRCSGCGFVGHRDAVGAVNQVSKAVYGCYTRIQPTTIKYRRPFRRRSSPEPGHVARSREREAAPL